MAEEAKDETKTIPAAINRVRIAVFAIYFTLPAVALSALPVSAGRRRRVLQTLLGLPEEEGGFAGDPILGVVKQIDLGPLQSAGRDLRRPAGGDDPVHRDQRGHHRRLAARLLDGHPPPGARPAAPAAPEVPARRGSGSCIFSAIAIGDDPAGPGGLPRQHLRVRRDAVVHDRARLAWSRLRAKKPDVAAALPRARAT